MFLLYGTYLAAFILVTILVESELFGWATTSLIITGAIYAWLAKLSVLEFVKSHYEFCLEVLAFYMALGVAWSFIRWFLFLLKFKYAFRAQKESFLTSINKSSLTEEDKKDFESYLLCKEVDGAPLRRRPQASNSKRKIIGWMCFWPSSMVGYVLNDPVRRLFNGLFDLLKNSYQKMADALLNDPDLK